MSFNIAEAMAQASIDGMVALDSARKIIAWNHTLASWSGQSAESVTGKDFFEVFSPAADTAGLENAIQNALLGFKSFLEARGNFCFPGYYETYVVPLRAAGTESVSGVLLILQDVARRVKIEQQLKRVNEQLQRQNAALQQANDDLAVFARIAAHDLKEPLRKIYTFAELIMMRESARLSKDGRSNFRRIQQSVQRMGLLTDDIVNFSGLSQGFALEPVDLSAVLAGELLFYKNEIARTGALLECQHLPVIWGNPAALHQMLHQLLSNAFKFRRPDIPPHIRIRCQVVDHTSVLAPEPLSRQYFVCITVADNGIGFDMAYKDRIFELFQRLHPTGTYPGSGMGMAIVRKAVQLHGGFVQAESVLGEGSVMSCFLPMTAEGAALF